jgi:O-antigen ligase
MVILSGLFFTLSRGAWLGSMASISVLASLYLLRERDPGQMLALLGRSPRRAALLAAPVVVMALVAVFLVATRWDSRPDWLFRASLSPRYDAVQVGLDVFRDRPWLGAGPGTYPLLYNAYSGKYPVENIHPHNGYLNTLDDVGLAGAVVLFWGGVLLAVSMVRAFRDGDQQQRQNLAACAAALTSLGVHSLVDSPNAWYTALLPLAVVVALTLRLCPRRRYGGRR